MKIGSRVTLPEYTGAPGCGVNYGNVKEAEVVKLTPKFATVRQQNSPEMAAMFGPTTDIRIPVAVILERGKVT